MVFILQVTQAVGQEGKAVAGGVPVADGIDTTGGSAMDRTEDEGETKPMED